MFDLSWPVASAIIATFLLAGAVKGMTGMGLPTVAMAVLGALFSPLVAASLLIAPSLVTNVWQMLAGPALRPTIRRLWTMMLAICAGTVAGTGGLATVDPEITTFGLGAALVAYATYTLAARQLEAPAGTESWLSPLIGLLTGLITGVSGIFVIPAVPYLQALGLSRDDLVQALGLSFTVSTVALAVGLGAHGVYSADMMGLSLMALAPALMGMWMGQKLRNRISPAAFRQVFLLCLLLLGLDMMLRSIL